MNPFELLKELSAKLNVEYETQDWGIINADPDRAEEFLEFYENNSYLDDKQKFQLCELIIASFNEVMIDGKVSETDLKRLRKFILKVKNSYPEVIEYWTSLDDYEEFPIAKLLNDIKATIALSRLS